MLRYSALDSNNLKYDGEDFVASCAVLMEQFSVPADDLVERLESKMFELSNGKVGPGSAVSSRHIEAVRQQLVKKRKQEEQFDPTVEEFLEMQREDKQVRANRAQEEFLRFQSAQRQEAQQQREQQKRKSEWRKGRLRNEKKEFEKICLLRTYPSIKSAVWAGMPPPDTDEEPTSEVVRKFSQENVTIVVEVVSNCQTALSVHQCFSRFYASIDSFHFPHALHHVVMIRRCAEYFPPVSRSNLTG